MCIRNYLILIVFILLVPRGIRATGLSADIIYIQGEKWSLMAKPIHADSAVFARLRNFIPENHCASTANWEGYTGFWEIRRDSLYLQKIEVCLYNPDRREKSALTFHADALKDVFAAYYTSDGICARWFSGEMRAGKGEFVSYVHLGFARHMETEKVMTVKKGKITSTCLFHNYKKAGLNLQNAQAELIKRFPWEQFPEVKGKRLSFYLRDLKLTDDGRLVGLEIPFVHIRPGGKKIETVDDPLIKAFKEVLKAIYPWEVLYVNGEYTADVKSFVMPIWEKFLVAHTSAACLEAGVPVCYLNERGDTLIPFGKYRFCRTDTIKQIGFAYENRENGAIVCLDSGGNKLFNVFGVDNGADYVEEGLFRITDNSGLVGFADTLGRVIIPPQFKFAFPFKDGKAKVSFTGECKEVPGSGGEKYYWDSNRWLYVDKKNNLSTE